MVRVLPAWTCSLLKGHTEHSSEETEMRRQMYSWHYFMFHFSTYFIFLLCTNPKDNMLQRRNAVSCNPIITFWAFCQTTEPLLFDYSHIKCTCNVEKGLRKLYRKHKFHIDEIRSYSALPELSAQLAVRNPRLSWDEKYSSDKKKMKKTSTNTGRLSGYHEKKKISFDLVRRVCACVCGLIGGRNLLDSEARGSAVSLRKESVCVWALVCGGPGMFQPVSEHTCTHSHTQGAVVKPKGLNQTPEPQQALSTPG